MYFKLHSYTTKKQWEELISFTLIVIVLAQKTKRCSKSLKVAEKERAGQFPAALLLPPPDQKDWCGVFSVGYLPCYMLSIQLGVTTVSAVQNPLEKSAIVKVWDTTVTHWEPEGSASQELAFAACVVCAQPNIRFQGHLKVWLCWAKYWPQRSPLGNSHKSHSGLDYHQYGECIYL